MARPGRPNNPSDPRVDNISFDIEKHDNEKVKQLLAIAGIDAYDRYLRTALIWAACYNNTDLLNWLIANSANTNHQDISGFSALHFAGQNKNEEVAKILIEYGADLELRDIHGNTPIFTAIFNSKYDFRLVKLYVKHGASLDNLNKYQKTPRQLAEIIAGFDLNSLSL
ncbi:MAG: ankyrin repeat domain-containing protein [Daejeonella sp.]